MMELKSKWRKKAQVVAWLDIVLTIIGIVMVFCYAYFLANEALRHTEEDLLNMWRQAGFIGTVAGIQLCFALVLRNATKIEREVDDALTMSAIWLIFNHGFFLIWFICSLIAASYILAYVWLVVRAIFLYVGWNFMLEMEQKKKEIGSENQSQVTTKV